MSTTAVLIAIFFCLVAAELHSANDAEDEYYYTEDSSEDSESYSIKEFLTPGDLFWVFNTSEKQEHKCKMDVVESANESSVYINRYVLNGNITKTPIKAVFAKNEYSAGDENTLDEIQYSKEGSPEPHHETLVFASTDGNCGVFFVEPPGNLSGHYEIRLKSSAIGEGPGEECLKHFMEGVGRRQTGRSAYNPECQCIVEEIK